MCASVSNWRWASLGHIITWSLLWFRGAASLAAFAARQRYNVGRKLRPTSIILAPRGDEPRYPLPAIRRRGKITPWRHTNGQRSAAARSQGTCTLYPVHPKQRRSAVRAQLRFERMENPSVMQTGSSSTRRRRAVPFPTTPEASAFYEDRSRCRCPPDCEK
jgi:hypothetical protein